MGRWDSTVFCSCYWSHISSLVVTWRSTHGWLDDIWYYSHTLCVFDIGKVRTLLAQISSPTRCSMSLWMKGPTWRRGSIRPLQPPHPLRIRWWAARPPPPVGLISVLKQAEERGSVPYSSCSIGSDTCLTANHGWCPYLKGDRDLWGCAFDGGKDTLVPGLLPWAAQLRIMSGRTDKERKFW